MFDNLLPLRKSNFMFFVVVVVVVLALFHFLPVFASSFINFSLFINPYHLVQPRTFSGHQIARAASRGTT